MEQSVKRCLDVCLLLLEYIITFINNIYYAAVPCRLCIINLISVVVTAYYLLFRQLLLFAFIDVPLGGTFVSLRRQRVRFLIESVDVLCVHGRPVHVLSSEIAKVLCRFQICTIFSRSIQHALRFVLLHFETSQ